MYGGGVEAGTVDCDMPIRATALRGQLRFWWRLLNDTGQGPEALFEAESALWGGISGSGPQASRVVVRVKAPPVGEQDLAGEEQIEQFPSYALIVKQGANPRLLKHGYRFELALHFKRSTTREQRTQVVEALRWWASFAGVGARTRRGLGAVKVTGDALRPVSREEVEARGGRIALGKRRPAAFTAWQDAVGALERFRQGRDVGRNRSKGSRPGRSRWPEADTIRKATDRHAPNHAPEHPALGSYPRAAFGLPIVFHFKDPGDPDDLTLEPAGHDRMASPLILRPWFDGEQYRPLALLLPGWQERLSVKVEGIGTERGSPAWPCDDGERARAARRIKPLKGRGSDALSAFMRYFEERR